MQGLDGDYGRGYPEGSIGRVHEEQELTEALSSRILTPLLTDLHTGTRDQ